MAGRLFRRTRHVDGQPATPLQPPPDPHAVDVRLFTIDGTGDVELLAGPERVTDLLNAAEPVRLRAPRESDAMVGNSWVEVDEEERDEILAVIPPARTTDPQKRLHRLPQEVSMRVGSYVISGDAHVPAGAEATGFLLRHRPHFVPLTNAIIRGAGLADETVPVAIVNLRIADALSSSTLDTPAAPPPLGRPFGAAPLTRRRPAGND
ncbi:MAG TPA: hypothetical protein VF153_02370 [Candidatus Limnocylindria bacterium]